mgnify:CR=1 FL=1
MWSHGHFDFTVFVTNIIDKKKQINMQLTHDILFYKFNAKAQVLFSPLLQFRRKGR